MFSLILLFQLCTSCNGQTKTEQPKETVVEQVSFTCKSSKLTKTQGSDQYQQVTCSFKDKTGNIWFSTTGEGVCRNDSMALRWEILHPVYKEIRFVSQWWV